MHERKDAGRGQPRVNPDLCEWLETREGGLLEEGLLGFQEGGVWISFGREREVGGWEKGEWSGFDRERDWGLGELESFGLSLGGGEVLRWLGSGFVCQAVSTRDVEVQSQSKLVSNMFRIWSQTPKR